MESCEPLCVDARNFGELWALRQRAGNVLPRRTAELGRRGPVDQRMHNLQTYQYIVDARCGRSHRSVARRSGLLVLIGTPSGPEPCRYAGLYVLGDNLAVYMEVPRLRGVRA